MIFNANHVELDPSDTWFMQQKDTHIGYDRLADLYHGLSGQLAKTVKREFSALELPQHYDFSLEESLGFHRYLPETTYLAGRILMLNSVINGGQEEPKLA